MNRGEAFLLGMVAGVALVAASIARVRTGLSMMSLLARWLLVIARVFTSASLGLDYALTHFRTSQHRLSNEDYAPQPAPETASDPAPQAEEVSA